MFRTNLLRIRRDDRRRLQPGRRGFTLLEVLVVIAIVGIIAAIIAPNFVRMIRRARIQGAAETMNRRLIEARAEAITHGAPVVVVADIRGDQHWLVAWVDVNENEKFDGTFESDGSFTDPTGVARGAGDYLLYEWLLPYDGRQMNDVYFWHQGDNPGDATAIDFTYPANSNYDTSYGYGDFPTHPCIFLADGSVETSGSFFIAMGNNDSANYLELRITPKASGRVELAKYIPEANAYHPKRAGWPWLWY